MTRNRNKKISNNDKNKKNAVPQVQGQGGYYTDKIVPFMNSVVPKGSFAKMGSAGLGALGAVTGVPGASQVGSFTGKYLGGEIAKLLGFGTYRVQNNSIMKAGVALPEGTQIPGFASQGHETRICHREYICDIVVPSSPTAFKNTAYAINAGNASLFPWLSGIAANYQQYRFSGLVFEYRTMSSDITSGGALGTVSMATDYDAIDSPFVNKISLENSQYSTSCKPSMSMLHAVECAPMESLQRMFYVQNPLATLTTSDQRFYNVGNFQVATTGLPSSAGTVIGELWASYDVTLFKPLLGSAVFGSAQNIGCVTGVAPSTPFGSAPVISGSPLANYVNSSGIAFNNVGQYTLVFGLNGTGFTSAVTTGSTSTVTALFNSTLAGATTPVFLYNATCTAVGQTFQIAFASSTFTLTDLNIFAVGNSLVVK